MYYDKFAKTTTDVDSTTEKPTRTEQADVSSTEKLSTKQDEIINTISNTVTTDDPQTESSSLTSCLEITTVDKLTMSTNLTDRTTHKAQSDMSTSEQLSMDSFTEKTHLSTGSILTSINGFIFASTIS